MNLNERNRVCECGHRFDDHFANGCGEHECCWRGCGCFEFKPEPEHAADLRILLDATS